MLTQKKQRRAPRPPTPGARRTPAERRFRAGQDVPSVRARLKKLLAPEAIGAFVARALPYVADQEKAVQALRLVMAGFTFAHAGRECGVPTTTIVGWWARFENQIRREANHEGAKGTK